MERINSQKGLTWHELMGSSTVVENGMEFALNFDEAMWKAIKCAQEFEILNLELPENVRNIALRKEKLQVDIQAVTQMIDTYKNVIKNMKTHQVRSVF